MAIQVGINGFGRIGRSVFRILSERDDINVVCINDLFENEQLAYLLKYDTVMGIFQKEVRATADALYVDEQKVIMTEHRNPAEIPWKDIRRFFSSFQERQVTGHPDKLYSGIAS